MASVSGSSIRPAEICKALLAALDASDGRRRSRKRDQTPDAIGLHIKRELLERAVAEDPSPDTFEEWLLNCASSFDAPGGAVAAMARTIFEEWRLAHSMNDFKSWLQHGAPSDDAKADVISSSATDAEKQTLDDGSLEKPPLPDPLRRDGSPPSPSPPPRGKGDGELA